MAPQQAPTPTITTDAPDTPIEPQGNSIRSRSNSTSGSPLQRGRQFLDTLITRSRSRSSSRSSRYSLSSDSVKDVIANLGLAAGTVGVEQIGPKVHHDEKLFDGVRAFLDEFQNLLGRAKTGITKGPETIQVRDDAQSVHSITEAETNPFCSSPNGGPPAADRWPRPKQQENSMSHGDEHKTSLELVSPSRHAAFPKVVYDVFIWDSEFKQKVQNRARVDTGMAGNAITHSIAKQLGYPIVDYTGFECLLADGSVYHPPGQVNIPFHFDDFKAAKTWRIDFAIFPDESPFDLCLGIEFISVAGLLKPQRETLVCEFREINPSREEKEKFEKVIAGYDSRNTKEKEDRRWIARVKPKPKVEEPRKWDKRY